MAAYSPAVSSAAIPIEIRFWAVNTVAAVRSRARPGRYCVRGTGSVTSRVSGRFFGHTIRTVLPGVFCTTTYGEPAICPLAENRIVFPGIRAFRNTRRASESRTAGPSRLFALWIPANNTRAVSNARAWNQSGVALNCL